MDTKEERLAAALKVRQQLGYTSARDTDLVSPPELGERGALRDLVNEFAFGEVWNRPGLDVKTRCMLTLAAAVALQQGGVGLYTRGCLNLGVTREEVTELIIHVSMYSGIPSGLTALGEAQRVFTEFESESFVPRPEAR